MENLLPAVKEKTAVPMAQISALVAEALAFQVVNLDTFQTATEKTKRIKQEGKELEAVRTSITGPVNAALDEVNDYFRQPKAQLKKAEDYLKAQCSAFLREQEQRRQAEQDRINEARRKAAEEEEEKRREAQALLAIKNGEEARAEAIIQAPLKVQVAEIELKPDTPAIGTGFYEKDNWKAEITDLKLLLAWCFDTDNLQFVQGNEKNLGLYARTCKEKASAPGVRFFNDKIPVQG